jgi:hypothetical protein
VYYHANDATSGSPPVDSRNYIRGDTAIVLGHGNLSKDDYTFLGWRVHGSAPYYTGDRITINFDDINFHAVWDDGINTPFSFVIKNDEVSITRYNEDAFHIGILVIPDTLQSKPVTAIEANVFSNLSIRGVSLPRNLKNIGIGAFASNRITQLLIPDSVESIGIAAFQNNEIAKVTLGKGLTAIAPLTFRNNNLADITIPDNITSIGDGAFLDNDIEMVIIGANVDITNNTALGTYGASFKAFYDTQGKLAGVYLYTGDTWVRF